ncbi:uncharacterized protein HKW66_Vig0230450 [Vigna angularis]|uniref:Uncharacterized protein n=1 Tax=Phaseolus angularis TaxID=3914 RepID=A0A8T0KAF5_PHAAN|nr:uncharacterized protein HKW66_Vig0230450 [Vigna angularis]
MARTMLLALSLVAVVAYLGTRGPLNAFSGEEFREVVVVDFVLVIVVVFGIKEVGVIRIGSNVIGLLKEDTFGEGLLEIESVVVDFVLVIVVVIKEVGVIRIGSNVIGLLKEDTFGEGLLEIERGSGRRQEEEWVVIGYQVVFLVGPLGIGGDILGVSCFLAMVPASVWIVFQDRISRRQLITSSVSLKNGSDPKGYRWKWL